MHSIERPSDAKDFTLKYRLERRELARWYWWAWRQPRGLWSYWMVVWLTVAAATYFSRFAGHPGGPEGVLSSVLVGSAVCAFFILYPQIMYEPRERVLRASEAGLDTSIGDISGHRNWRDIASITDRGTYIAITVAGGIPLGVLWLRTSNGNAFIIPDRAFSDTSGRIAFLQSIRAWHARDAVRFPRLSRTRYYG